MTAAPDRTPRRPQPRSRRPGIPVDSAELTMVATKTVPLDNEGDARKVLRLIDALEDHDDVQNVYANFDIPDAILELVEA